MGGTSVFDNANVPEGIAIPRFPYKYPVRVGTAAKLSDYTKALQVITADANGALTIDGVTMTEDDRILHTQGAANAGGSGADAADNGIYVVTDKGDAGSPFILTRATDMNETDDLFPGAEIRITEGTLWAGKTYVLSTTGGVIDVSALSFVQTSQVSDRLTGTGTMGAGVSTGAITVNGIAAATHVLLGVNIESDDTGGTLGGIITAIISGANTVTVVTTNNGTNADAVIRATCYRL